MQATAKRTPKVSAKVRQFLHEQRASGEGLNQVRQLLRERCKNDLWFLCYHVLKFTDIATDLHVDMCERWERRREVKFSLWMTPRFHLKTSLWTRGGTIQELLINPDQRILIINAVEQNALDIIADIRLDWETNEVLRWLFPEYCPQRRRSTTSCRWGVKRLDFPCSKYAGRREGNIQVLAVESSLVSKHYDLLIFDDPVNDINTTTKEYRDKIERWYRNALQLRESTESRIRLIGTRWHFDDLYSRILKSELKRRRAQKEMGKKVKPRYFIYHRAVVEKVGIPGTGERIAGYDDVAPIWPERFNKAAVEELREENGSYIFSCQFMNNPVPEEDAIFKLSHINFIDDIDIPENVVNFVAIDLAVEDTEQGDMSVITVASFDEKGNMYVRKILRDRYLPSKMLEQLDYLVRQYQPLKVGIETTVFQKTIYKVYKNRAIESGIFVPWTEIKRGPRTTKLKRFLALQPRVERGDFYVEDGIRNQDWLIEEMTTYPRAAHDDILDTLADLEALYFKAPEIIKDLAPKDTFDAFLGSIETIHLEDDDSFGCEVLNFEEEAA